MTDEDIGLWVDFVRGILPGPRAAATERRLADEASARERKLVDALRRVREVAREEARHEPPAHAVRSVEAYFRLRRPKRERPRSLLGLGLVFDSALAPAQVGARSLDDGPRQLLFQNPDYALDVRIDYPSDSRKVVVVGQVLQRPASPVRQASAYLMNAGEVTATGFTSDLGSFYMEGARELPLELRLVIDEAREIAVSLDPPAAA